MNTNKTNGRRRLTAPLVAAVALAGGLGILAAGSPAGAQIPLREKAVQSSGHTVSFTTKRKTEAHVDATPTGPSAGDETLIAGKVASGDVKGYSSAECTVISPINHGIAQCEVDFLLRGGSLMTRGVSSPTGIQLAVVGGTGRYAGASGSGLLVPTDSGTNVTLHLL